MISDSTMYKEGQLFPVFYSDIPLGLRYSETRVQLTGEYRPPKRGEYYISGTIPEGYIAYNDMDRSYHIAKLVRVIEVVTEKVVEVY